MRLRIIAGTLKGRFITIPERNTEFRPTLERTRQSVIEIIKYHLPGAVTADVCAGSGAFGFEMISRGALRVDFVEKDRRRADLLVKNSRILSVSDLCRCIVGDVKLFIKRYKGPYQVIFYDPPYADEALALLVPDLLKLLAPDGILVYERALKHNFLQNSPVHEFCFDSRDFGDTVVEFYRFSKESKRFVE
jgi:16S rRNA (guanine966-N2)-methyltransferase